MSAKRYQADLTALLKRIFAPDNIKPEWFVRTDADDKFADAKSYAPRLDIGMGPFNSTQDTAEAITQIKDASNHPFIQRIKTDAIRQNDGYYEENPNPRCLLAIEIEFQTSSKHILGGYTNASMMGLLGVIIGPADKFAKIRRIGRYAQKLKEVGKCPVGLFSNISSYTTDEFMALVRETCD